MDAADNNSVLSLDHKKGDTPCDFIFMGNKVYKVPFPSHVS